MVNIPKNRFSLCAVLWFAAAIYLLFCGINHGVPPFAHFDKAVHFSLFFAQFWLLAKAFMQDGLAVPYGLLLVLVLLLAVGSEAGQELLTHTRKGSVGDVLADILGACVALWLANRVGRAKFMLGKSNRRNQYNQD